MPKGRTRDTSPIAVRFNQETRAERDTYAEKSLDLNEELTELAERNHWPTDTFIKEWRANARKGGFFVRVGPVAPSSSFDLLKPASEITRFEWVPVAANGSDEKLSERWATYRKSLERDYRIIELSPWGAGG